MSISTHSLTEEFRQQWQQGMDPDVGQFVAGKGPLLPPRLTELLIVDQSFQWERGKRKTAEQYFEAFPELSEHRESAIDLIFAEFLLHERFGLTTPVEDFVKPFPQFSGELQRQIEFHQALDAKGAEAELRNPAIGQSADAPHQKSVLVPDVPGYEILEELGRGGIGVVYKARHRQLNRPVALKMLLAGHFASASLLRRFLVEAEATARLQHPNIVQIYEVGQHEGCPFLALEFVNGGTLAQWAAGRPQPPREAARLVVSLARAVQFAHEQGVVHRDLKPGNVLMQQITRPWDSRDASSDAIVPGGPGEQAETGSGKMGPAAASDPPDPDADARPRLALPPGFQIKVADFGLAKLLAGGSDDVRGAATMSGDVLGTAAYMSPEQAQGKADGTSGSTDVYSIGAILYELLTGRPPFVGVQPLEVLAQVIADEPVRPSRLVRRVPADIQTICLKCLEKPVGRRYASAAEVADDLDRFLADQPIVARHCSAVERSWRWCRRHPVKTSLAASLATILILVASISSVYSVILGRQLTITSNARNSEQDAKIEALVQLWESKLSQADTIRASGQVGQCFDGLQALVVARETGRSVNLSAAQVSRMRNATIACLARPDIRLAMSWPTDQTVNYKRIATDKYQTVYACPSGANTFIVRKSRAGGEIARIDAPVDDSTVIFSPDGRMLAVVNEVCRVYRLDSGSPEPVFEASRHSAWGFTQDGRQILGADEEGTVALFDLQDGHVIRKFPGIGIPDAIAISPDSRWFVIDVDDSIQVLDLQTGDTRLRLAPSTAPGKHFAWHPDSKVLAIGPYPEGIVLWNADTGCRLTTFPQSSSEMDFCFGARGDLMLVYDIWNRRLNLWNVGTGELELSQPGLLIGAMSVDESGGFRLLQLLNDARMGLLVVERPQICASLPMIHEASANPSSFDVSFSPDDRLLAFANNGNVDVFDANGGAALGRLVTGPCFVHFDHDGSLLTLNRLGLSRWPRSGGPPPDGNGSAAAASRLKFGPPRFVGEFAAYTLFDVSSDGKVIAVPDNDGALIWTVDRPAPQRTIGSHADVRRLSISPDGQRVVTGGWNGGKACIWDTRSGQLIRTIDEKDCCLVQYSRNGKWLVTNSDEVKIRDAGTGLVLLTLPVSGHSAGGVTVSFSPDSRVLAVSDDTGTIHLFNPGDGTEIASLTSPGQQHVVQMEFDHTARRLAVLSIAANATVRIWDLAAIHDGLHERELDWSLADGTEFPDPATASVATTSRPSTRPLDPSPLEGVSFVVDEGWVQLEADEQVNRAQSASSQLDFDSARAAISRAEELGVDHPSACNSLAWLLATGPLPLRDPESAIGFARHALADPTLAQDRRALYTNTLGVALYRSGKVERARKVLEQSLAMQPPKSQAFDLYFLAMCHSRLGDLEAARQFFDRAETLVRQFQSTNSYAWRVELNQFAAEARLLLIEQE